MPAQYEKNFKLEGCVSGVDNHFQLRFPPRGDLNKVILVQASGDFEGFEFDIYNSKVPLDRAEIGGAGSSSAEEAGYEDGNYKVIPTQAAEAGAEAQELLGADNVYPYANRDGSPTNMQRFVYIRVKPGGAGEKEFQLSLGMLPPDP